jgi:hypothetical protein
LEADDCPPVISLVTLPRPDSGPAPLPGSERVWSLDRFEESLVRHTNTPASIHIFLHPSPSSSSPSPHLSLSSRDEGSAHPQSGKYETAAMYYFPPSPGYAIFIRCSTSLPPYITPSSTSLFPDLSTQTHHPANRTP